jgi:hypothetical protein
VGAVTTKLGSFHSTLGRLRAEPSGRPLRTSYLVIRGPARRGALRQRHWQLRVLSVATLLLLSTAPRAAEGQNNPQGRVEGPSTSTSTDYDKLLDRAVAAFDGGDYVRSRELFEQAYALRPNARVLRGLGISAVHLERYTVAKRELTEALREDRQALTANQREGVTELLSWMQENLGTVRLQLDPSDAYVTLDDEPVSDTELVVKPGSHRIAVRLDGFATQVHTVDLGEGQKRTLDIELLPSAKSKPALSAAAAASTTPIAQKSAESPSPLTPAAAQERESSTVLDRWWFWTAIGVVVAGGVATTVALTTNQPSKSYEKGGLGGVIMPLGRIP